MADQESVTLEPDPRSVLAAVKQANQAVEGWEKQTIGSGDKMQKALERMGDMLLKINDRSRGSMERLTQSIEKQAAAYGKTGVERMVAERDRLIKKLGDEQGMIDRVTAAYRKMIDAEEGAVVPQADSLKRSIDAFTAAIHHNTDMTGMFASMLMPLFFAGGGTVPAGGGGGAAAPDVSNLPMTHSAFNPIGALAPTLFRGATSASSPASRFYNAYSGTFTKQGLSAALSNLKNLPTSLRNAFWNQAAWNATDSNIWGAISAVGTSPAIKSGTAALGGMGISYGLTAPPSAATDLALIGGGAATGGPLGAAFGAAGGAATAGFKRGGALGALEMGFSPALMLARWLSGYEDPVVHTKDLVKQLYTIDIDTNTGRSCRSPSRSTTTTSAWRYARRRSGRC